MVTKSRDFHKLLQPDCTTLCYYSCWQDGLHFQVLSYAHYFENCNLIKDYIEQLKQTACFNIIKTGKELNIAVLNNIMYPWTPPIYIIMSLFIHWSPKGNKRTSRNQEIILCNILRHLKSQSIAALTKRD